MSAITKIFGTHSERELKRIYPLVDKVESYREAMGALSDEELKNKTKEYKERLENGETLDDLLPEAYATVREAAKRVLGEGLLYSRYTLLTSSTLIANSSIQLQIPLYNTSAKCGRSLLNTVVPRNSITAVTTQKYTVIPISSQNPM